MSYDWSPLFQHSEIKAQHLKEVRQNLDTEYQKRGLLEPHYNTIVEESEYVSAEAENETFHNIDSLNGIPICSTFHSHHQLSVESLFKEQTWHSTPGVYKIWYTDNNLTNVSQFHGIRAIPKVVVDSVVYYFVFLKYSSTQGWLFAYPTEDILYPEKHYFVNTGGGVIGIVDLCSYGDSVYLPIPYRGSGTFSRGFGILKVNVKDNTTVYKYKPCESLDDPSFHVLPIEGGVLLSGVVHWSGNYDSYVVKFDPTSMNPLSFYHSNFSYNGQPYDYRYAVAYSNGKVIVAGTQVSWTSGDAILTVHRADNFGLIKGVASSYGQAARKSCYGRFLPDDNVIAVGGAKLNDGNYHSFIALFDPDLTPLETKMCTAPSSLQVLQSCVLDNTWPCRVLVSGQINNRAAIVALSIDPNRTQDKIKIERIIQTVVNNLSESGFCYAIVPYNGDQTMCHYLLNDKRIYAMLLEDVFEIQDGGLCTCHDYQFKMNLLSDNFVTVTDFSWVTVSPTYSSAPRSFSSGSVAGAALSYDFKSCT